MNWQAKLSRFVKGFNQGNYLEIELLGVAIELIPTDSVGEAIALLPPSTAKLLHEWAVERATWSDQEWERAVSIRPGNPIRADEKVQSMSELRRKVLVFIEHFNAPLARGEG